MFWLVDVLGIVHVFYLRGGGVGWMMFQFGYYHQGILGVVHALGVAYVLMVVDFFGVIDVTGVLDVLG